MHKFQIVMQSFQQVQDFVRIAARQPFDVVVGNERQQVNGKDIMGMFSLDYRYPLQVSVCCSEEDFTRFEKQAAQFLV